MNNVLKSVFVFISCTCFIVTVKAQDAIKKKLPAGAIYTYVEQMPSPTFDLGEYIGNNIHYPDSARYHNIEGRVVIRFVVNEDGSISDCTATTHLGDGLEEEGVRVMRNMPKWKPGMQNGVAVKTYFTQPIRFKLEDDVPAPAPAVHEHK